jgi:hypothetical protein
MALPAIIVVVPVLPAQPPEAWGILFSLGETALAGHPREGAPVVAGQEVTALAETPTALLPVQEQLLAVGMGDLAGPAAVVVMMAIPLVAAAVVVMRVVTPIAQEVVEPEAR